MKSLKLFSVIFLIFCFQKSKAQKDTIYISPNPFGGATTIYFELEDDDTASLYVYNRFGEIIRVLFEDSFIQKGKHTIKFNRDSLKVGVYTARLILTSRNDIRCTLTIIDKASVNLITLENSIQIYPNPVMDLLTINTQNFERKVTKISLFDMLGKDIILENSNLENQEIQLNIHNISDGNYILKLQTEQGFFFKKIIKTH